MSIQEIEQAITKLPPSELNELVAWLRAIELSFEQPLGQARRRKLSFVRPLHVKRDLRLIGYNVQAQDAQVVVEERVDPRGAGEPVHGVVVVSDDRSAAGGSDQMAVLHILRAGSRIDDIRRDENIVAGVADDPVGAVDADEQVGEIAANQLI